jgi:hypothetical protein
MLYREMQKKHKCYIANIMALSILDFVNRFYFHMKMGRPIRKYLIRTPLLSMDPEAIRTTMSKQPTVWIYELGGKMHTIK